MTWAKGQFVLGAASASYAGRNPSESPASVRSGGGSVRVDARSASTMAAHSCTLSPFRRQTRSEADRCRGARRHLVREVEVFEPPRRLKAPLREQPRRRLVGSAVVEDRVEHLHLPPPRLSRRRARLCPPNVRTSTIRPSIGRR